MVAQLRIALLNLWSLIGNSWRRLLRQRVDYIYLDISGALPEYADAPSLPQRLLGMSQPDNLADLRQKLQRIADDPHARGIILVLRDFSGGWATAESLRGALFDFRARGKRVIVYLPGADTPTYFAACAANVILMPETAYLNVLGLLTEALFLREALHMLGIESEVTTVSPYKSGGDIFTRSDMSPENREQVDRLLDRRYTALVTAIAADRNLSPQRVEALIDGAPYTATTAQKAGLIDDVCYEDELKTWLANDSYYNGNASNPQNKRRSILLYRWREATRALHMPYQRYEKSSVAVVRVEGAIMRGESRAVPLPLPILGGEMIGSDSIIRALRRVEREERVAALVLFIDSPGGDAFASDLIWREVLRVRQKKPVVVSMGNVAASGGYYIATCASVIFALPATITGSIGVFSIRPIATGLLERIGITATVLSRGARAGLLNITRPPSEDDRAVLRRMVLETYEDFKQRVRSGRGLSEEQLEALAGGRVWTGLEAKQAGLVDELGALPAAIAKARELAHLPADPYAAVEWVAAGKRRDHILPQPFPSFLPGAWLEEVLRFRVLMAMPWVLKG